jgi:hypothetical protein
VDRRSLAHSRSQSRCDVVARSRGMAPDVVLGLWIELCVISRRAVDNYVYKAGR